MSKIVFILGAGASAESGAPLMYNFLDKAEEYYFSKKFNEYSRGHIALKFLLESANNMQSMYAKTSVNYNNIENLFSLFDIAKIVKKYPGLKGEYIEDIESIELAILATLQESILFYFPDTSYPMTLRKGGDYGNLVKGIIDHLNVYSRIKKCDISFITFNYDLCIETALRFYKSSYSYCLDNNLQDKSDDIISILKLHGSINWFECKNCNTIDIVDLDFIQEQAVRIKNIKNDGYDTLPLFDIYDNMQHICKKCANSKFADIPLIVPPTFNKTSNNNAIVSVWKNAALELSNAEYIYIIGYSLPETDMFFKYLFSLGIEGPSRIKSVIVINKDISTEERFKKLLNPLLHERFIFPKKHIAVNQEEGYGFNDFADKITEYLPKL